MNRKRLKTLIAFVDLLLMQLSLVIMLLIRYGIADFERQWEMHFFLFAVISLLWLLVFYIGNLYNLLRQFSYMGFAVSMTVNIGLAVSLFYLFPNAGIAPKTNLALFTIIFIILMLGWRNVLESLLDRLGIKRPVIFIGMDPHSLKLARIIVENPRLGYTLTGVLTGAGAQVSDGKCNDINGTKMPLWLSDSSVICMKTMEELIDYLGNHDAHSLVVSENWYRDIYLDLYRLFPQGIRVYQLSTFWEQVEETIPVNATDEIWFLQNISRGPYTVYHRVKRALDVIVAIILFPIMLPFILFTVFLVRITSKGPVIFKQTRVGLGNREFTIYKFRSMRTDAEKHGAVWAKEKDPRLTPVGNFIRKFRLDELPQIFNVLKGDMSFIGPRPERPEFVGQLAEQIPHYNLRHMVKPGLSGWAQVKYGYGASVEDSEIKLMHDLYYVKNVSPLLDIKIALKTIYTIVSKGGR